MPTWSPRALEAVASTDDLHGAPCREDGAMPATLIWIWSVAVHISVFVRSANPSPRRFAAAMRERAGNVRAGDCEGPATFTPVTDELLEDEIEAAYAEKHAVGPYFSPDSLEKSRQQIARISLA